VNDDLSGFSMLELFRLEAESQAEILSSGVLAIEEQRQSAEIIESLMRAAHSLKGAARIVGLDAAVQVAHALEDVFLAAGNNKITVEPTHADILLTGIDFLSSIAAADDSNDAAWQEKANRCVQNLQGIVSSAPHTSSSTRSGTSPSSSEVKHPEPPAIPPRPIHEVQKQLDQKISNEEIKQHNSPDDAQETAANPNTEIVPKGTNLAAPPPLSKNSTADTPDRPKTDPADSLKDDEERVVRVSAGSLTRLVGLAGESLVEARQLRPFADSLLALREYQTDLCDQITAYEEKIRAVDLPASQITIIESLRQQSGQSLGKLTKIIEAFEGFSRRNEDLSERLHREVIFSRMRPLADGIHGFPRLVRDVSRQLHKQVRLIVRGEQTGVDRDILDKLEAPLSHLIRNALDHGMELPEERLQENKPANGTITIDAGHRAGSLTISITDDGRGVNLESLKRKIIDRELVTSTVAERLSEPELLEFLFLPGFSTRNKVTEISGRGVGLDVVQTMVKAVGGSVRITTQQGIQTCFTLQLPITMSVIRALLVDIGGEPYAFPLPRIDHILTCRREEIASVEARNYIEHDGNAIGLVHACDVFGVEKLGHEEDRLSIVVVSDRGQQFGLVVNAFSGERDLEVRPLDSRLGKVPNISSASLLENGDPVLIVDIEDLVRSIDSLLTGRGISPIDAAREELEAGQAKRILVVDDSITVRELERQLLHSRGYEVDVAVDGMDGWNAFRSTPYDLVVSDVDMPRMDGIGLVTLIKTDAQRSHVPVVIVSYKDREEDRLRGLDAGANRYLTKSSFQDDTFLETIVDLIGEPTG
jgi:two-component system sensor histidine kinase and response regulator WspE